MVFAYSFVWVKINNCTAVKNVTEEALVCGSVTSCLEYNAFKPNSYDILTKP